MKILVIGDLHGNKPKIHFKGFDAIIAPGDFCSDSFKKYIFQVLNEKNSNPQYKKNWYDIVGKSNAKQMMQKSVKDGRKILEFLNSFDVPVYVVPGNWDWAQTTKSWDWKRRRYYKELIKDLENIVNVHRKIRNLGQETQIIGFGITSGPEYPQDKTTLKEKTKGELERKRREYQHLLKRIDLLFRRSEKPVIFLTHNVPYNTRLDEITEKFSNRYGLHYGSLVARKMIEKYQPLISIGGHMHEHFGKDRIKRTICLNSGYGSDVNTLIELKQGKVKHLDFWGEQK